ARSRRPRRGAEAEHSRRHELPLLRRRRDVVHRQAQAVEAAAAAAPPRDPRRLMPAPPYADFASAAPPSPDRRAARNFSVAAASTSKVCGPRTPPESWAAPSPVTYPGRPSPHPFPTGPWSGPPYPPPPPERILKASPCLSGAPNPLAWGKSLFHCPPM